MSEIFSYAEVLNRECRCKTLCEDTLEKKLAGIRELRPNLFSKTTTYLDHIDYHQISSLIKLIEKVIKHDSFVTDQKPRTPGVLMGYDFHLTDQGPKLIEINTNAGGIYLNLILAQSQIKCCAEMNLFFDEKKNLASVEHVLVEMFRNEWKAAGHDSPLKSIAIVDEKPSEQYLYPEFQLFRDLFKQHGIEAFILDPSELKDKKVDLIYNRLTDFTLSLEKHQHLKDSAPVITPAPIHHTLYANKNNLSLLTSRNYLEKLSLSENEISLLLNMIPLTKTVKKSDEAALWSERKNFFFKPVDGFGSKATYRGDKLTRKVWNEILEGEYVAQGIIPPGHRVIAGREGPLKADIRAYTYDGQILLLAARLYEGQTTNFRTEGGGFSPVFVIAGKEA